jgi:hypothetical protein
MTGLRRFQKQKLLAYLETLTTVIHLANLNTSILKTVDLDPILLSTFHYYFPWLFPLLK